MSATYLALDLGGTNAKFGLVDQRGRILIRDRLPVRPERGPDAVLNDLGERLAAICRDRASDFQPLGAAVGAAGLIAPDEGVLLWAPNLPGWRDVPVARHLERALNLPTRLINDADLFTLGEWLAGAGLGLTNMIGVTLGTGVGGGLILSGRLWRGPFGSVAEIGHTTVFPDGHACACGRRGCLETEASATAAVRIMKDWLAQGRTCSYRGDPNRLTSARICELAEQGDELAMELYSRVGRALGVSLANVFNLLGLEGAVFGGGAASAFPCFRPALEAELSHRVMTLDPAGIRLARSQLGDDAPLAGAPALFEEGGR
jgi:glucokinase